jgi:peptide/nickel transport system ATP-binding protein
MSFDGVSRRYAHQLSGGMQQRVVNAGSLVSTPDLVIADEPTHGLDADRVDVTAEQLLDVVAAGSALLVITHDLRLAEKLGGRLALLYASHLVELRPTAAFFARPAHPYGRGLLGALIERGGVPIPGLTPELTALPPGCPFAPRCTEALDVCRDSLPPVHAMTTGRSGASGMLIAERVTKTFDGPDGRITVLDGTDLSLAPGARLGLVGPSGCGKSTLAAVLALLVAPDTGRVVLDGAPVAGYGLAVPKEVRRRVQLVWQSPRQATDPRLTLQQTILEPLAIHRELPDATGEQWELAVAWAARMGLTPDLLSRYPHEVSDGQLQRACLACALVLRPCYLLCDEPTSMLDVSTQAALLAAVAEEQQRCGLGVLLITHDLAVARHWCDEVVDSRDLAATAGAAARLPDLANG